MRLVFATHNTHKVEEVRNSLPENFELLSLLDLQYHTEIPETGETLQANALIKAQTIYNEFGIPCFADDSGLEVEALQNQPGVFSARYAGESATFLDNCNLLLRNLENEKNRSAQFRTVFCYVTSDKDHIFFEGVVKGKITREFRGDRGFGYDPLFLPEGHERTFAEMTMSEKNAISHRSIAVKALLEHLYHLT